MKLKFPFFIFILFFSCYSSFGQKSNQVPLYVEFQSYKNPESCEINVLTSKSYFENKENQPSDSKYSVGNNLFKGLVSPGIHLTAQYKYEISFSYTSHEKLPASKYYVFLENQDNFRYIDLAKSSVFKNPDNTETRTVVFSVEQSDIYFIGLCTYNDRGFSKICLYDFLIDWFYAESPKGCSIKNSDRP
jgi:hypothetical protein